jgi:adenine/guanine phosphoribosyltransferase-like PRPP-binding protein
LKSKSFELVDDIINSRAGGALVALRRLLKEFTACTVETGFTGYITTIPVRRSAVGTNVFLTHRWNISNGPVSDDAFEVARSSSL